MQGEEVLLPEEATYRIIERRKKGTDTIIRVEEVTFEKRKYYRNTEGSKQCTHYFYAGKRALHRDIYEKYSGSIRKGNHIHHKNGYNDNRPESLEEVSNKEHTEEHFTEKTGIYSETARKRLEEYHLSSEGKQQHSKVSKDAWKEGKHTCTVVCVDCGRHFEARVRTAQRCTECKKQWNLYRKRKEYKGIERTCAVCGKHITGASSTKYCPEHKSYWKRPDWKNKVR
jgi:hypothetical protein